MSQIHEWKLVATNLYRIAKRKYEVAVLPVGAIEAHNHHLPEGQDYLHSGYVAERSCELAWPKCESVICLPPIILSSGQRIAFYLECSDLTRISR